MCYSFGENTSIGFTHDPVESINKSNLKEEYRLLFNQMRDHYKNLSVHPNHIPTATATRKLTVTCIKSRGKVESNNKYHYNKVEDHAQLLK